MLTAGVGRGAQSWSLARVEVVIWSNDVQDVSTDRSRGRGRSPYHTAQIRIHCNLGLVSSLWFLWAIYLHMAHKSFLIYSKYLIHVQLPTSYLSLAEWLSSFVLVAAP